MRSTCATIASLMQIKDVTEDDARLIRKIWPMSISEMRAYLARPAVNLEGRFDYVLETCKGSTNLVEGAVDRILRTHGVEYLGQRKRNRNHVYYCNAGDTYATTVLFDGDRLTVGCIGDLVEKNLISERGSY